MANRYRGASFSGGNTASLTVGTGFEPSKPLGSGRGPIRTAMANDSYQHTLKDRMAARRADKAMGGAVAGAMAPPMPPSAQQANSVFAPTSPAAPTPSTQGSVWKTPPQVASEPRTQWEMNRAQRLKKNDEMRAKGFNPTTGRPMGADPNIPPAAPLQGRALAERNIATMGADGAAADYFQRRGKSSWKTPPPLTADIGKADVMPNKRKRGM